MYGNGRPTIGNKKLVRVCLALTFLAWATQVLFKQWGYGAEMPAVDAGPPAAANPSAAVAVAADRDAPPAERFVAPRAPAAVGATLEIRAEATVRGAEVRLKQVARWANRDAEFFRSVGEVVVARIDAKGPYRVVGMDEVRRALADAGVSLGMVRFAGATSCTINRGDARPDGDGALAAFIDAKEAGTISAAEGDRTGPLPTAKSVRVPGNAPPPPPATNAKDAEKPAVRPLRDLLTEDLSVRLRVPAEQLQVTFNPKDDRVLNLCEPQFRFNLEPVRARDLGEVSWAVTVVADGQAQKASVVATARAWQAQVVVNRPVAARSVIRPEDVAERRTLADRLPDEPLLTAAQAVGQQAARDLRPGTVLSARMVEAVPLTKNGQLVTVTLSQGSVRVKSVARAVEGGSYGQRVKVRNEATNEVYDVVMTGPQEAVLGER